MRNRRRRRLLFSWRRFVAACVAAVCVLHTVTFAKEGFLTFTDPDRRFSIEFPNDWRWTIVAGSREALVTFVQPKSEAAVVVERIRLRQALAPDDITDLFAQIESDVLKENQPKAADIAARALTQKGKRVVVIDYTRPGLGARQRVRQYSFPVGQDLYRVTCMALATQFQKYEMTFASLAETLRAAGELDKPSTAGR
jgi:hypothetical protein